MQPAASAGPGAARDVRPAIRAAAAAGAAATTGPAAPIGLRHVSVAARAMGGRLGVHVAAAPGHEVAARLDARRAASRVAAWARLLTRHDPSSPLMALNADPRSRVPVRPTLGAALAWGAEAGAMTGGVVDVTRLDDRLRAEHPGTAGRDAADPRPVAARDRGWHLAGTRRRPVVERVPGLRFDLDGVGKGWLADRALDLLAAHPGALVDADGDVAIRVAPGDRWEIGVADPRDDDALLAVIVLGDRPGSPGDRRVRWGVATSGTTVHRFGPSSHHLIDPRTGRPAVTDVVQATVVAAHAATAEVLAKAAVIVGASEGLALLERSAAAGAVLLLEDGRVLALPRTTGLLA